MRGIQTARTAWRLLVCAASTAVLAACGGGGGASTPDTPLVIAPPAPQPAPTPQPTTTRPVLLGGVTAGAAACSLSVVDGAGTVLGTGASDASGRFEMEFDETDGSVVRVLGEACAYEDELTGEGRTDVTLSALVALPGTLDGARITAELSPVTRAVDLGLSAGSGFDGVSASDVDAAHRDAATTWLGQDTALLSLRPAVAVDAASAEADEAARDYGLWLAVLSAMEDTDTSAADVSAQLAAASTMSAEDRAALRARIARAALAFDRSSRNATGVRAGDRVGPALRDESEDMPAGEPPRFAAPDDAALIATVGEAFTLELGQLVSDPDGDALTLFASGLPLGLGLDTDGNGAWRVSGTPEAEGTFAVDLLASDGRGRSAAATLSLVVEAAAPPTPNTAPTARLDASTTAGQAPLAMTFSGEGSSDPDGAVVQYAWDFGDGSSATGARVSHSYQAAGTYTATLTVTDDDGATATDSIDVVVSAAPPAPNTPPTARIAGEARSGAAPLSLQFDGRDSSDAEGELSSYSWDFGDGNVATGALVSHTFVQNGTFTVRLTVTDADGASATATQGVTVAPAPNRLPTARIAGGDRSGEAPLALSFDGAASADPDGEVQSFRWSFGDGATATGAQVSHTFAEAGTYSVTLDVTDDRGGADRASVSVAVSEPANQAPTARIAGGDRSGALPLSLSFDGRDSADPDGRIVSFAWDFGDGATATGAQVSHTFEAAGSYAVSLVVTDEDGASASASVMVSADAPPNTAPVARFVLTDAQGPAPHSVSVDASGSSDSDGQVSAYAWDFGDGTVATGVSASHSYAQPGTYTVRLVVTDDDGATDAATRTVSVTEPPNQAPTARINGGDRAGEAPLSTFLNAGASSDPDGTVESYLWNLGDGRTDSRAQFTAVYDTPGTYTLTLTVRDDDGAAATATRAVVVSEPPNQPPTARLQMSALSGTAPFSLTGDASGSADADGTVAAYAWSFGDGATATGPMASHTYTEPGTFTLIMTVTDEDGATAEQRRTITVSAPANQAPVAVINGGDRSGEAPFGTFFNAGASTDADGTIASYQWDLGDGRTRTADRFNVTYDTPGTYTVTLTVTDDDGASASATRSVSVSAPVRQVAMPIEVLGTGAPGTTTIKSREFVVADGGAVAAMALTCHRCDYRDSGVNADRPDKASYRLNGGDWIDINDGLAEVAYPESAYGGIEGAYHTVRFTVPVAGLVDGVNTAEFRFNGTDGFTNGYRLIDFNMLDAAGRRLIAERDLVWDDPTAWEPPLGAPLDLQRGQELWNGSVTLAESPLSDTTLRATCADCHASDGSDLKYFNYSNETISVRAQFHGLSKLQGDRIASYIRSLDTPNPKQARPWNPPYQPGPGLDSLPVEEWAAGAGLDAVLDHDADMLGDMFPNGTGNAELRKVTSTRNTINVREQRIALQLPDWKMWLPEVHPKDLWGDDWETLHRPDWTFAHLLSDEGLGGGRAQELWTNTDFIRSKQLLGEINDLGVAGGFVGHSGPQPCLNASVYRSIGYKELVRTGFITEPAQNADKDATEPFRRPADLDTNPDACETWLRSMSHWKGVKLWEAHTRFQLEDKAPLIYPYGEARSWLGKRRAVFEMAPHRSGNDAKTFRHLTVGESSYASHAWYQLQVILNAGNRNPNNHTPPDWKYQMNWMWANSRDNDVPSSLRYVQTLIKMQQNLDMRAPIDQPGGAPDVPNYKPFREDRGPVPNGWWTTTHVGPQRFVSIGGSFFKVDQDKRRIWWQLDDIEPNLRVRLQNYMLRAYLDKTLTYTPDQYQRGNTDQTKVSDAEQIPTPWDGSVLISSSGYDHNQVYRSIPFMREFGMSETQIARLIDWGEQMWPLGDWDALRP